MTISLEDVLPPFDCEVPANGYRWWYVDGLSDCRRFGIVVIGFVGSVFSPYYFRARQRGAGEPEDHCAINVALYSPRGKTWAMTERGRSAVSRTPGRLAVARNEILAGPANELIVRVDDRSLPWLRPMRGELRIAAGTTNGRIWQLDEFGRHHWQPVAPSARISVDFRQPACRWEGDAYVDSNSGAEPLEAGFRNWDWSRCRTASATHIRYRATERSGNVQAIALRHEPLGGILPEQGEPAIAVARTGWGIERHVQSTEPVHVSRTLEDTPFYARSLVECRIGKETAPAMHESLSLERFRKTWVRTLLPFRMPRLG